MEESVVRKYVAAGDIAERAKRRAEREVKSGVKLLELVSTLESYIVELGGRPAFPVNVSVNSEAAHRTPCVDDESAIPEDSVVKVDIGVHVDGYIADTAITIPLSEKHRELVEAAREALDKALSYVKPSIRASDIGSVIERTIRSKGFRVVKNLSGHSLGEYTIHAGETIPNYRDPLNFSRLKPGAAYAIEPFATTGSGVVHSERRVCIYAIKPSTRYGNASGEQVISTIFKKVRTLPFTERWFPELVKLLSLEKFRETLRELSKLGYLIPYPVLSDTPGSYVAQFEETVILLSDKSVIVTTSKNTP